MFTVIVIAVPIVAVVFALALGQLGDRIARGFSRRTRIRGYAVLIAVYGLNAAAEYHNGSKSYAFVSIVALLLWSGVLVVEARKKAGGTPAI